MEVLVIDDDVSIAALLDEVLTDEGYMVATAVNSSQAEAVLSGASPTLILLDLSMHESIRTSLQTLRNDGAKDIPIVLMSAGAQPQDLRQFGAIEFLPKPFALDTLLKVVQTYVTTHTKFGYSLALCHPERRPPE